MVVDELRDVVEVVLLGQVELSLRGGADVVMFADATGLSADGKKETIT